MSNPPSIYTAYRFWVEFKGVTEAAFSECSGLQAETEIFEWEEGGWNAHKHRMLGRRKYSNIVLKRGIATRELLDWYHKYQVGQEYKRLELSIILHGYNGSPELRWNVVGALPVKWVGPTFKSGSTEVAVETFELVHHGLDIAK